MGGRMLSPSSRVPDWGEIGRAAEHQERKRMKALVYPAPERVGVGAGARCGVCEPCKRQLPFCMNGGIFGFSTPLGTLQGGQAEFVRVPFAQRIMHPIADHLKDED